MTTRLAPYGSEQHAHNLSKVGKEKSPRSLASRMPSAEVLAKVGVGKNVTPLSLAERMPSPDVASKVGTDDEIVLRTCRVIRLNERG